MPTLGMSPARRCPSCNVYSKTISSRGTFIIRVLVREVAENLILYTYLPTYLRRVFGGIQTK